MVYVSLWLDAPGLLLGPRDLARQRLVPWEQSAVLSRPWHTTVVLTGFHSWWEATVQTQRRGRSPECENLTAESAQGLDGKGLSGVGRGQEEAGRGGRELR